MTHRALIGGTAALAGLALLAGAHCSFSSGDDEPVPPSLGVWIDDHEAVVATEAIALQGQTECGDACAAIAWEYGSCPELTCPTTSDIDVFWVNETTGDGGTAPHGYWADCSCSIVTGWCHRLCEHYWSALVPLAPGPNALRIHAVDAAGVSGDATTQVERVPPP